MSKYRMGSMKRYIHESNLIEGFDDPEFDKQGEYAWEFLSGQTLIDAHCVKKVQKIITLLQTDLQPDQRGYFRKVFVNLSDVSPWNVATSLDTWLWKFKEFPEPKKDHISFEKLHPFVDGNGRTGRMLMWWQEIKLGKRPTLIRNATKQQYYKWFV